MAHSLWVLRQVQETPQNEVVHVLGAGLQEVNEEEHTLFLQEVVLCHIATYNRTPGQHNTVRLIVCRTEAIIIHCL